MTSNVQPTASTPSSNASAGAVGMRSEIEAKWGKFSATEVADLKDKDDLVAKVQHEVQPGQGAGAERRRHLRQGPPALTPHRQLVF